MVKKIGIGFFTFALGLATSIFVESGLRRLIQTLFKILTSNAIHFYGKDFHLFASSYYYLSFGLLFLIIWIFWNGLSTKGKIANGLMTLVIFFISIVMLSWWGSMAKIVACTACNDGTRGIHYNDVNYDAIIAISLLISILPTGFRQIKMLMEKAASAQK